MFKVLYDLKRKKNVASALFHDLCIDIKQFSIIVGFGRIISKICIPFFPYYKRNTFFWGIVYKYIKKHYRWIVRETVCSYDISRQDDGNNNIWVMWWQGESEMPDVIKMCFSRLMEIAYDYSVVLITRYNWSDYVSVPDYILDRVNNGDMTITHLSDLIRCYLLKDYGGLWLDASIYAEAICIDKNIDFYTLRTAGELSNYYTKGNWSTFVLYYRRSHSLMMECMCAVYEEYWKEKRRAIIYEMPDFIIQLICEEEKSVKDQIDAVPNSYNYRNLVGIMNQEYSDDMFSEILEICPLQKLTYKKNYNKLTEDGKLTTYGFLCRIYL